MSWLSALGGALSRVVAASLTGPASAPALTIGTRVLTVGDLKSIAGLLNPSLEQAVSDLLTGRFDGWPDATALADADLEAVAIIFPATAPLDALAEVAFQAAPILASLIASGAVTGGSSANQDVLGRGGRRG